MAGAVTSGAVIPGAVAQAGDRQLDPATFGRWFGRWAGWGPAQVAELLDGAPFRWWVAGGWALEEDPLRPCRHHADVDVAVLLDDLPAVRAHVEPLHCWEAHDGTLRPLLPGDELLPGRHQLWVRADAASPWLVDVVAGPSEGGSWCFRRHPSIRLPLDEVGVVGPDGVPRLRPEVVLLFKAKHRRPQDEADLDAHLPRLDRAARTWLGDALVEAHPGHPWSTRVRP